VTISVFELYSTTAAENPIWSLGCCDAAEAVWVWAIAMDDMDP
jgi:hypothetical protein